MPCSGTTAVYPERHRWLRPVPGGPDDKGADLAERRVIVLLAQEVELSGCLWHERQLGGLALIDNNVFPAVAFRHTLLRLAGHGVIQVLKERRRNTVRSARVLLILVADPERDSVPYVHRDDAGCVFV